MSLRFLNAVVMTLAIAISFESVPIKAAPLRVCADPDNLPFSNRQEEGFENRLAAMLARSFGDDLEYVWQRMGRGFVRENFDNNRCDLVIGVPSQYRPLLTTPPYYRSTYVFVTRRGNSFEPTSIDDPKLTKYRIAVDALEEEYTPPGEALARHGLQGRLVGMYSVGAHAFDSVDAVSRGDVDIAIVWGPIAGYAARKSRGRLRLSALTPESDGPIPFTFSISMGVKKGNQALHHRLEEYLTQHAVEIHNLLASYGVPLLPIGSAKDEVKP
jgi:mxaJ protein